MRPRFFLLIMSAALLAAPVIAAEKAPAKKGPAVPVETANPTVAPLTYKECIKLGGVVVSSSARGCGLGKCKLMGGDGRMHSMCINEFD